MNLPMMREVIRISDQYLAPDSIESIDRQGRLINVVVAVLVFHALIGIAFVKMEECERNRIVPQTRSELRVSLQPSAMPQAEVEVISVPHVPAPPQLDQGKTVDLGGSAAPRAYANKTTIASKFDSDPLEKNAPRPSSGQVSQIKRPDPPLASTELNQSKMRSSGLNDIPDNTEGGVTTSIPSGSILTGGSVTGTSSEGSGTDGNAAGGTGYGIADEGSGRDNAIVGGPEPLAIANPANSKLIAHGNIAPYRRDLLTRIARNWEAPARFKHMSVLLTVGTDGQVLSCEVFETSGKRKWDDEAVKMLESMTCAPLPDWYKGNAITFKLSLNAR